MDKFWTDEGWEDFLNLVNNKKLLKKIQCPHKRHRTKRQFRHWKTRTAKRRFVRILEQTY